jgi:hypothetical protein
MGFSNPPPEVKLLGMFKGDIPQGLADPPLPEHRAPGPLHWTYWLVRLLFICRFERIPELES